MNKAPSTAFLAIQHDENEKRLLKKIMVLQIAVGGVSTVSVVGLYDAWKETISITSVIFG